MSSNPHSLKTSFITALCACLLACSIASSCYAATVKLQWDANTEADLAGYKVYYKADSSSLPLDGSGAVEGSAPVDVGNQTSATISGLDPSHTYYFAVTAYNISGVESSFSNMVVVAESSAPSASITFPSNNSNVSGVVLVTASASDNIAVTKVDFYLNDTLVGNDTTYPYIYSWNSAAVIPGVYSLSAKAFDAAGNVGQSSVLNISVVNDVSPPTVLIISPSNNATVAGNVPVSVSATDNVGISKVEFYLDGILLSAMNMLPYNYIWDSTTSTKGSHLITVKAYDSSNNVATATTVSVLVENTNATNPVDISGDLNSDGIIDILDVMIVLNISVGKRQPTTTELIQGDIAPVINGQSVPNGKIDTGDAIVILSKFVS